MAGHWYDGEQCEMRAQGGQVIAVAIVERPEDPRCRIWPWLKRREEAGHLVIEEIPVFKIFTPDWPEEGGAVLDVRELFSDQQPSPESTST